MAYWRDERQNLILQNKRGPFRQLAGMMRDVYHFNVLTAPHLRQPVSGQPLAAWVASGPDRGTLQEVADQVWVWAVPEKDLSHLRESLAAAGLLIARPASG